MYGRRVWLRWSMIEQLETRALPSAVTPVLAASLALPDSSQGVAEIASLTADVQRDRDSLAHSDGSGLDDQSRDAKSGSGNVVDPPDRNNVEPADESKLPRSLNVVERGFSNEAEAETRRTGPWPDAPANDAPANGQATTTGLNGGSASDFADASSLVGWSSGAAMPLMMSAAFLPEFLSGLGRLADHADGYEAGPIWPLGIGATMALLLAIRPSYGRRRLFRRSVQGLPRASGRHPVPFGPWPLSPR
jgi:hypothetical protein